MNIVANVNSRSVMPWLGLHPFSRISTWVLIAWVVRQSDEDNNLKIHVTPEALLVDICVVVRLCAV